MSSGKKYSTTEKSILAAAAIVLALLLLPYVLPPSRVAELPPSSFSRQRSATPAAPTMRNPPSLSRPSEGSLDEIEQMLGSRGSGSAE